tara:strand:+ start:1262 stop:1534 length:273 start_codon:yes stop_codon:yes gene_type:complete
MPPDRGQFPTEVQEAFMIHDLLPDRWEGMSGSYLGKDWAALSGLLKVYEIEEPKLCVLFLKNIEAWNQSKINKELQRKQSSKSKGAKQIK